MLFTHPFLKYDIMIAIIKHKSKTLHDPTETRTKASIRYAKENDREKRGRRRERERKVEGEI